MSAALYNIFVLAPFVLFLILLIVRKTPLLNVSAMAFGLVSVTAMFAWKVPSVYVFGSLVKGVLVAMDIFFIIFGAILFLEILKKLKIIENIGYYLESISSDLRIQVILLGWFFTNFLEGTAGFGTAATVVVPLLVSLGLTPINAVIIGLFGNSAPGLFGAAGTPIKIGFGNLATADVAYYAALINIVGMFVPVFILWFITRGRNNSRTEFLETLPFAIWSGAAFSFPAVWALYFGQEFPTIIGSVVGLGLVLITTKLGLFVPKKELGLTDNPKKPQMGMLKVLAPYALLLLLLVAGKFAIGQSGLVLKLPIPHTLAFYNPGFAFIVTTLLVVIFYRLGAGDLFRLSKLSLKRSLEPFLVIALMSALAQIMVNSGKNSLGLPSMVNYAADSFNNYLLPVWAPLLGAFGSFLTGSVTVSNIMFGNFLAHAASDMGFTIDKILALGAAGGAAGNMIALGDMITAEAVAGIRNRERIIIKSVIIPCLIYVALIILAGIYIL